MSNYVVNFLWEFCKVVVPSFLAWFLATNSSKNSFEKNRIEMREQLKIAKENNREVQNNAFKLQFCIKELDRISEQAGNCASSFFSFEKTASELLRNKDVISMVRLNEFAARFDQSSFDVSNNIVIFQTVINAVNPNSKEAAKDRCTKLMEELNTISDFIVTLNKCVLLLAKNQSDIQQQFPIAKREIEKIDFEKIESEILNFREFVAEHIDITFRKLR
ncbi:MAG: hypothetical protein ABF991_11450 [Liquorilactobacillus hordei]|uniref:hypothetical protein n=1 Tax=Liquorilactobacillus hordei TaxID=468911 RepID=UPI0039E88E7A